MVLIYVVITVILLTINNEAFDVQCGSIECVQLKFFFLTFISDMKLTTQSNSFLYRYRCTMYQFFQILAEEITPTLTKLKEVHLLCIKRAVIMCIFSHKII